MNYAKLISNTSIDRNPPRQAVIDGAQEEALAASMAD